MIAVIDIEASGLVDGYPVEIGWACEDGTVGAVLIRPPTEWIADLKWDPAAEQIHGLTREILEEHGISPAEALAQMNVTLRGARCLSDAPAFDWRWLTLLVEFAEGGTPTFELMAEDADASISASVVHGLTRVADRVAALAMIDATQRGRPHSAAGDAARWMAALELGRGGLVDDGAIKSVIEKWDTRARAAAPWRSRGT